LWRASIDDLLRYFYPSGWYDVDEVEKDKMYKVIVTPNPFTTTCTISFPNPLLNDMSFTISDINGNEVCNYKVYTLDKEMINIKFTPEKQSGSIYVYQLNVGDEVYFGKLVHMSEL